MRVRSGAAAIAGLALALTAPPIGAAPSAPEAAVSEARLLSAALDSVTGLVASFTQTMESPALPSPQVERGTVYLLRPGRMRFEYDEPRGKLAIADGRRTWLYLPEERQVVVAPIGAAGGRAGVAILLDERIDLVRDFRIEWGPVPAEGGAPPLKLTPRTRAADYESLLVSTDPEHLVRTLAVVDALGGRVTYRFTHTRRQDSLDPALFRFVVPSGVEVQESPP
jgi:outer membrane lipoprotein carrier protein